MITTDGRIVLDPDLVVRCGDHRYRIAEQTMVAGRYAIPVQIWTCERCGDTRRPSDIYVDCAAGPVTP